MKKVGNFIFIFFLLLMCAATAFETISQLKYADYSKICPVSIDSVQKLDEQNIKAIAPPDETLDIARYDYYLMVCTIENQSATDGSFYPGSAFCSADGDDFYYAMDTAFAQWERGGAYQWYVPAGENIQVSFILEADKGNDTVMARDNPSVTAELV